MVVQSKVPVFKISVGNASGQVGLGDEYGSALKGVADVLTTDLFLGFENTETRWFLGAK